MKIYLGGTNFRKGSAFSFVYELAKENGLLLPDGRTDIYALDSFAYITQNSIDCKDKVIYRMLDSGAFSFINQTKSGGDVNWEKYVDEYSEVAKELDCPFFEVDVDGNIGFDKVLQLRKRLEHRVGRQCIPVWHKDTRTLEQFKRDAQEYDYVAIGGVVTGGKWSIEQFKALITIAHENGAKIHGLGITGKAIHSCHFDSVDSTSWLSGARYGNVYVFNQRRMTDIKKPPGKRCVTEAVINHNFAEWVKFQKWADTHL